MDALRRTAGYQGLQHLRNDYILERMNMQLALIKDLERKILLCYRRLRRSETTRWPKKNVEMGPKRQEVKRGNL